MLDEPTNDLDIETLELLEELLADYPGTVLLVSHDRAFLDAVVTQAIAFEGDGRWLEYAGGYADVVTARERHAAALAAAASSRGTGKGGSGTRGSEGAESGAGTPSARRQAIAAEASSGQEVRGAASAAPAAESPASPRPQRTRLSYKEQRELEALPAKIDALETEQAALATQLSDPQTYRNAQIDTRALSERHAAIETELAECLERWEALEARVSG